MKKFIKKLTINLGIILIFISQVAIVYFLTHRNVRVAQTETLRTAANTPIDMTFELRGLPAKGSESAKVAVVEFSDYECPYCAIYSNGVGKKLHEKFVARGMLKYVFSNNPLSMHSNALYLANSAICAGQQDRYWEMHDSLFSRRPKTRQEMISLVKEIGLNSDNFQQCIDKNVGAERIDQDLKNAERFQLKGTPAFAIGRVASNEQVVIEKFIFGAQSSEVFEEAINDVLSRVVSPK